MIRAFEHRSSLDSPLAGLIESSNIPPPPGPLILFALKFEATSFPASKIPLKPASMGREQVKGTNGSNEATTV